MAATIEKLLSLHFRRGTKDQYTGRKEPGKAISAKEAQRYCEYLSDRQRRGLNEPVVAALSDLFDEVRKNDAAQRRVRDIKKLKAAAWFSALRTPDQERAWTTLSVVYGLLETWPELKNSDTASNWQLFWSIHDLVQMLAKRALKLDADQLFTTVESSLDDRYGGDDDTTHFDYALLDPPMKALERLKCELKPSEADAEMLAALCKQLEADGYGAQSRAWINAIKEILGGGEDDERDLLWSGEPWAAAVNASVRELASDQRAVVVRLLKHAATASEFSKPAKPWFAEARTIAEPLPSGVLAHTIATWLNVYITDERAALAGTYNRYDAEHQGSLRANTGYIVGIVYLAQCITGDALLPHLANLVEHVSKAKHDIRLQTLSVATAALRAINAADDPLASSTLSMLALRVRWPKLRKAIEKAFDDHLKRKGLSRDDVDEAGVPDFGFVNGALTIRLGDGAAAELTLGRTSRPRTSWTLPGKLPTSTAPKSLKGSHPEQVQSIKQTVDEIEKLMTAQRTRLDLLFRREASWPLATWRQRYLDHGLLGTWARRLIWLVDGSSLLYVQDGWEDVKGRATRIPASATVSLWHPAMRSANEVLAWRRRLEALEITQPIKQAHREVYLLTDAERNTVTYSNRFAAHIVRNQATLAISQVRKWKMGLYGGGMSSPTLALPHFGLRAEWWVDAASADHDRLGFPLYLTTDQVRFVRDGEENPMPLEQVPPLAFSEVMRDVDLFVSLASVGNDPTWHDGGPTRRYRDYWQSYSFGDLGATALTRRAVLQRLVPRLKIASRCSITDKFLVVRGDLRTYKIHLGSGNILMEPNDQYLCIVPSQSKRDAGVGDVLLPFEGDTVLSIILSKAFLLAEDTKITDPTITRQIKMN